MRLPGRILGGGLAPRGRRRRRCPLRPSRPGRDRGGGREALAQPHELGEKGPRRAALFTWDATARAHDRVYELAIEA